MQQTFSSFPEDDLCGEAVLSCRESHYTHWFILYNPPPPQPSPLLFVASSSVPFLFVVQQLFPNCRGYIFHGFFFFFLLLCDAEHTVKATVWSVVWHISCHNHFPYDITITATSAASSQTHTHLVWPAARKQNNTASVSCHLWWFACLMFSVFVFHCLFAGIPFPIIVAWAIGKLYYENEQWVPSSFALLLDAQQLFVLIYLVITASSDQVLVR